MIDILMINSGPRPSSALEVLVHGLFCFKPKFFHEQDLCLFAWIPPCLTSPPLFV